VLPKYGLNMLTESRIWGAVERVSGKTVVHKEMEQETPFPLACLPACAVQSVTQRDHTP
jgi:hypothetical protein